MQAQPGETRAVFLRAETKAFRNRNVSGLDPNDRTLIHLVSRSLHADFCAGERVYEQHRPTVTSTSQSPNTF